MKQESKKQSKIIDGSRLKIGIVVSEFHNDITENLLRGALDVLADNMVKTANINAIWVPGSFELPYMCQEMAKTGRYNALIALGCVIKGETEHHRYISEAVAEGLMEVILKHQIPVGFGVITTNNLAQAKARSGAKENKGAEAAEAVLKLLTVEKNI